MRITGGGARGIQLKTGAAEDVRPATDLMRQAVFSSLGEAVRRARFLDLFAGTGAYGLEALSRGAAGGVFVEKNRRAVEALKANLAAVAKSLGLAQIPCQAIAADVFRWHPMKPDSFDLVFLGPPYAMIGENAAAMFQVAEECLKNSPAAYLVFDMPGEVELPPPAGWALDRRLGKGNRNPSAVFYQKII